MTDPTPVYGLLLQVRYDLAGVSAVREGRRGTTQCLPTKRQGGLSLSQPLALANALRHLFRVAESHE